jgi:type IX secretion system PorP/SprF family membrane protein
MRNGLIILFLLFGFCAKTQDIHFSQFFNAFQYLNPAETGNFYGKTRLAYNYRDQWRAVGKPFQNNMLSFEQNIFLPKDAFSFGFYFLDDRAGSPQIQANRLVTSFAYHKKLGIHHFHFGLQGGGIYKQLATNNATYPSQYSRSTGGFDTQLPNNEILGYQPALYIDVNAGGAYEITLGKLDARGGIALYHLNAPLESFYGAINQLNLRPIYDLRVGYQLTSSTRLSALAYQTHLSKANEMIYAVLAQHFLYNFGVEKNLKLTGGISFRNGFFRNQDAFIVMAGIRKNRISAMLSYDINTSNLDLATDNRGAMEVSVVYEIPVKVSALKYIPCERY